ARGVVRTVRARRKGRPPLHLPGAGAAVGVPSPIGRRGSRAPPRASAKVLARGMRVTAHDARSTGPPHPAAPERPLRARARPPSPDGRGAETSLHPQLL